MNLDISFLLPTNREPQYAWNTINSINTVADAINTDYKYEILVCSPTHFSGENIKYIPDNKQTGPIAAFNYMAAEIAEGQFTVCLVDDHIAWDNDFFTFMQFLNSDFFEHGRSKITSLNTRHIPQRVPIIGEDWCGGIKENHNKRHHTTARFPIVDQEVRIKKLQGYIFHPNFNYHAGDLWLGFYMGEEEGPVYEAPSASIKQYIGLRNYQYEKQDCQYYHKLKLRYLKEGYKKYV